MISSLGVVWLACACSITPCTAENDLTDEAINTEDLGRRFFLGELYDVNADEPIGGSLWPLSALEDTRFVREVSAKSAEYTMSYADSIKDNQLRVPGTSKVVEL